MVDFGGTELEKSKIRPQVIELELKKRFKQLTPVGKGKFFFSIFFNFLAELCHFKTFGEKKNVLKNFQKTLFGNFGHEGGLKSFFNIYQKLFSVKNS